MRDRHIKISDDTLRMMTDTVAEILFREERERAEKRPSAYDGFMLNKGKKTGRPRKAPLILYLRTRGALDLIGAAGGTRKDRHESRLGLFFTGRDLKRHR